MNDHDQELWDAYKSDASTALGEIEVAILELERNVEAREPLNELYRGLHSLKGNSAFFGLATIEHLAHAAEDVIGLVRDRGVQLDRELVELMLEAIDQLRALVHRCTTTQRDVDDGPSELVARLRDAFADRGGVKRGGPMPELMLFEDESIAPASDTDVMSMFTSLAADALAGLSALAQAPTASEALDRTMVAKDRVQVLSDAAERIGEAGIAGSCGPLLSALAGERPPPPELLAPLLDRFKLALADMSARVATAPQRRTIAPSAVAKRSLLGGTPNVPRISYRAPTPSPTDGRVAAKPASNQALPPSRRGRNSQKPKPTMRPRPTLRARAVAAVKEPVAETASQDFLRIDPRKVSLLLDLASEIGLAAGAVTHHPELAGLELPSFANAAHKLELLVREMQSEVSVMRLVPVSGVFSRMRRVVRDAARRTNKEVDLTLSGEETEIDKVMIDALADPLMHAIRNAIDHGIEDAEGRAAAGKPAIGRVRLAARHQGGEVAIEVIDDGRGLDRARILAKARERGLVAADVEPTPEQIDELIFLPGFSTKNVADELSGRGVGMDVVKTAIERLRGRITVKSVAGRGTRITMTLPLTLAFVDAMVVRDDDRLFALPIEKVLEIVKPEPEQMHPRAADGRLMFSLRGELFPVLRLPQVWGEAQKVEQGAVEARTVVVVQTSRGALALPVDALIGNQQVMIKPLRGPLANIRAAAGCGMLRSGDVALALDCEQLLG
jgi:two-component system chemotaxis sensor kinase CheA